MAVDRDPRYLPAPDEVDPPGHVRPRRGRSGLPPITFGTIVKLLVCSLVAGAVLAFLDLTPQEVLGWLTGSFRELVDDVQRSIGRVVSYVLLGAVVVVPIWAVFYVLRALRR